MKIIIRPSAIKAAADLPLLRRGDPPEKLYLATSPVETPLRARRLFMNYSFQNLIKSYITQNIYFSVSARDFLG